MIFTINIIPWLIGGIFNMVLGALWYSNILFAKPWMAESGVTDEQISDQSGMGKVYGLTMGSALLTSYIIGFIVTNFGITGILDGLLLAVLI